MTSCFEPLPSLPGLNTFLLSYVPLSLRLSPCRKCLLRQFSSHPRAGPFRAEVVGLALAVACRAVTVPVKRNILMLTEAAGPGPAAPVPAGRVCSCQEPHIEAGRQPGPTSAAAAVRAWAPCPPTARGPAPTSFEVKVASPAEPAGTRAVRLLTLRW